VTRSARSSRESAGITLRGSPRRLPRDKSRRASASTVSPRKRRRGAPAAASSRSSHTKTGASTSASHASQSAALSASRRSLRNQWMASTSIPEARAALLAWPGRGGQRAPAQEEQPMSLVMSRKEREDFLAGVHVGIISIAEPGRAPLAVPIWYGYAPGGELWVVTERGSRKGRLLAEARRFSLCAQTETPPYRYVSVEGPIVSIAASLLERDERPLAHRYLGRDLGDRYIEATGGAGARADNVVVRMRPERWLSTDYGKQFGAES
jgi:hypothetical protein